MSSPSSPPSTFELATKLTNEKNIVVIPIRNDEQKKPALPSWKEDRRENRQLATAEELKSWFMNQDLRLGICLLEGDGNVCIDTDGVETQRIFRNITIPKFAPQLQQSLENDSWRVRTPSGGQHMVLTITDTEQIKQLKNREYGALPGKHELLELMCYPKYIVQSGLGYEQIQYNDSKLPPTGLCLDKAQFEILKSALEKHEVLANTLTDIVNALKDQKLKENGFRHHMCLYLAGYLHKYGCPEWLITEIVKQIGRCYEFSREETEAVRQTCEKDPDSDDVSGYDKLIETLKASYIGPNGRDDAAPQTVSKIDSIIYTAADRLGFEWKRGNVNNDYNNKFGDNILSQEIKQELEGHIYNIISLNPTTLVIANKTDNKIYSAIVKTKETEHKEPGGKDTYVIKTPVLVYRNTIIDAIPHKIQIHENPLDKTAPRTYKITWQTNSNSDKHRYFTTGPNNINTTIEELANRNMIIKKNFAPDALNAIIRAYEINNDSTNFELDESLETSGYYYIDGKFVTNNITQNLDGDIPNLQEQITDCIDFIEALATKWVDKRIFPTLIKWAVLAPFAYILKKDTRGLNNWLELIHSYSKSGGGKTTGGLIALAVWRKHTEKDKPIHQLNLGKIDTPARLGHAVSQTTYPVLVDEVGDLGDKKHIGLVELIKTAVKSTVIRGSYVSRGHYVDTPALSSLIFTSNPAPPRDDGYRRTSIIIHYSRQEQHTKEQALEFDKWITANLDKLGILGDFAARYITKYKPDILFSGRENEDIEKEIITEFYKLVKKEKPGWLDLKVESNKAAVEDETEQPRFELRGFFIEAITNTYSKHYPRLTPISIQKEQEERSVNLTTMLDFCLNKNLVPYLHRHNVNWQIMITADVLSELKRAGSEIEGLTHLTDLAQLLGFEYKQKKIHGKSVYAAVGDEGVFLNFLDSGFDN